MNNKTNAAMKRIFLLLTMLAAVAMNVSADPTAYAEYSDSTLTFKYGTMPAGTYVYDVSNTGNNGIQWSSLTSSVKKVVFDASFANARPESCYCWFFGMINLKSIENIEYFNTSSVKYMNNMFFNCSSLTSLDVSGFNTSKVVDMDGMFYNCSSLTKLDVSGFNTSIVSDMSRMFYGCGSIKSLDVSGFNTSRVESMNSMFRGCSALTSLDLSGFDTKKVRNMERMFTLCFNLRTIYSNDSWSTQSSTDMFYGCSSLVGAISYNSNKVYVGYANPATGYFTYAPYGLTICGTSITGANYDKISSIDGVSGTVSYDPDHKILTLENATLSATGNNCAIYSEIPDLIISVAGNNTLTSEQKGGIQSIGNMLIRNILSDATMTVSGTSAFMMTSPDKDTLKVQGVKLTLDGTGYYGLMSTYSNTTLEIEKATTELKVRGANKPFYWVSAIVMPETHAINTPAGAYINNGYMYNADGTAVQNEWVEIGPKPYLVIGGVPVTTANCGNITGSTITKGTAVYDEESCTLTLTDCKISCAGAIAIKSNIDSLNVRLVGNCCINAAAGLESANDITILGDGKLSIQTTGTGINMTNTGSSGELVICDGAKVDIVANDVGIRGVYITSKIAGKKVKVCLKSFRVSGGSTTVNIWGVTAAVADMNKLVLKDGLALTAPVGAQFKSNAVCDADGNIIADKIVRIALLGDANSDGGITMADANMVVNYFLATNKSDIQGFDLSNANANGDADEDGQPSITMADANKIVNMFLNGAQ